jgi:ATP-dependent helicase/nuclease subunit A
LTLPEGEQKAQRVKKPEDWALPTGYETARNPSAELADRLAAQIKEWIEKGETVYDREMKADRPMNAGDVLVLVQRRGPFVEQLVRALKARAVPVSGADRMVLTEQLAVMDLIALLQFALLPEDDLTLACVLRGPLIGASEDDLMDLAIARKGSLWEALKKSSRVDWTAYLQSIAALADQKPPLQVLTHVLTSSCPADSQSGRRAFARRLGPDAEDPIDELLNFAEAFGSRRTPSLQAFLGELQESEAQIKREMEQAGGRVRIMTVHASKGLEAPVVILPDTARVPEKTKLPKLLQDEDGLPFYLPRDPQNARLMALREVARTRQMEENRRLLYVALTRPADRLVVCGYTKSEKLPEQSWYSLIAGALKPLNQKDAFAFESGFFRAGNRDRGLCRQNKAGCPPSRT